MSPSRTPLAEAFDHHQAGGFEEAERLYRRIELVRRFTGRGHLGERVSLAVRAIRIRIALSDVQQDVVHRERVAVARIETNEMVAELRQNRR